MCECCGNDEAVVSVCLDCAKHECDHGGARWRQLRLT